MTRAIDPGRTAGNDLDVSGSGPSVGESDGPLAAAVREPLPAAAAGPSATPSLGASGLSAEDRCRERSSPVLDEDRSGGPIEERTMPHLPGETPTRASRPLVIRVGKGLRPRLNEAIARHSIVPDDPVLDPEWFAWTADLRREWRTIRDELDGLRRERTSIPKLNDVSPDHARIAADGRWRSFFLYGYGYRIDENCRRAPRTAELVSRVPGLNSAFFSILAPGAHIPSHRGVTKALLTCHLGLSVPEPAGSVRMDVEGEIVSWREGECLVFDDSRQHEVWNETEGTRAVLLIQFRRPTRWRGRLLGGLFLSAVRRTAFVQEARRNLDHWGSAMKRGDCDA